MTSPPCWLACCTTSAPRIVCSTSTPEISPSTQRSKLCCPAEPLGTRGPRLSGTLRRNAVCRRMERPTAVDLRPRRGADRRGRARHDDGGQVRDVREPQDPEVLRAGLIRPRARLSSSAAATALGMGRLRLDPVDVEVALGEQPGAVALDEGVAIAKVGEHQLALSSVGEQVMGDAVALAEIG